MANADLAAANECVGDVAALENCIGRTPGPMHLKVIDHLDADAARWIASSPLMFATFGTADGIAVSLGGGSPGFADVPDPSRMRIDAALLDEPGLACEGRGVGVLFLIPGIGETLRVNGRVAAVTAQAIEIRIEECYVHCAKALIRSAFWNAVPSSTEPGTAQFLAASRFIALGTMDAAGNADLSPKGDPAGLLIREAGSAIWFADRPGNRRADSFRNMLSHPHLALAAIVPGAARIAHVRGVARIVVDASVRAGFAVQGKTPLLTTRIDNPCVTLRDSPTLARARPWEGGKPPSGIDPAAVLAGHVRLSKAGGLQAALARTVVSVPGFIRRGLERDYKSNLY